MSRYTAVILCFIVLWGCSQSNRTRPDFPKRDEVTWGDARFYVGMTRSEAEAQLSGAVDVEEFDPQGDATIIGRQSPLSDTWAFTLISPEPIGPALMVALRFDQGIVRRIEILDSVTAARRTRYGNPGRDAIAWGDAELELGMTKQTVLKELRENLASPEKTRGEGVAIMPSDEEAAQSVWHVWFQGHPAVGNAMSVRLTFDGEVLNRIQVLAMPQ